MSGSFKTEAIVLRSIRYGEADRVLHLYTADRGRVGAVAKGVRRVKSRLGGRLEPLSRVRLVMHQGRGELCTISQADTVHAHAGLREHRASLERGAPGVRGGPAAARLQPSRTGPPTTCSATSWRCSTRSPEQAGRAQALAFRLKLLLAAGFAPELASCAACGEAEHLGALLAERGRRGLRRLRGGLVPARRTRRTPSSCEALARPLSEAPEAPPGALSAGRPRDRRDDGVPRARAPEARRRRFSAVVSDKLVYEFTEGSRDMRDLLGGKGANVAEMTRVLGAERVPGRLHDHDRGVRRAT